MFTRLAVLSLLVACGAPSEPAAEAPVAEAPAAADVAPDKHGEWETFGELIELDNPMSSADLFAKAGELNGQEIFVEGKVGDVCQKAGCWMVMTEGDQTMRIMMKDHSFAVAKDCAGKTARIKGTLIAKETKAEDIEHLKSESQNPELMPEKAAGQQVYEIVASTVAIKG